MIFSFQQGLAGRESGQVLGSQVCGAFSAFEFRPLQLDLKLSTVEFLFAPPVIRIRDRISVILNLR